MNFQLKYIAFFLLILIVSCQNGIEKENGYTKAVLKPSKIDSLDTPEKVESFVRSIDSSLKDFKLRKFKDLNSGKYSNIRDSLTKILANKLQINKSFYKEDFDNNGFTDLLITGDDYRPHDINTTIYVNTLILMNYGNDSINIHLLNKNRFPLPIPEITLYKNQPFIKLYEVESRNWENVKVKDSSITTLTNKFDNFIEYNKQPSNHSIESIEFYTSGCMGICPVYKLIINSDRTATFLAKGLNFNKTINEIIVAIDNDRVGDVYGSYKGKIKEVDYNKLINTLNYIDFENLQDDYGVSWTDDREGELKITYNNGKVKHIEDYGMVGTYGLKAIYEQFAALRFNQEWQEVPEPESKK